MFHYLLSRLPTSTFATTELPTATMATKRSAEEADLPECEAPAKKQRTVEDYIEKLKQNKLRKYKLIQKLSSCDDARRRRQQRAVNFVKRIIRNHLDHDDKTFLSTFAKETRLEVFIREYASSDYTESTKLVLCLPELSIDVKIYLHVTPSVNYEDDEYCVVIDIGTAEVSWEQDETPDADAFVADLVEGMPRNFDLCRFLRMLIGVNYTVASKSYRKDIFDAFPESRSIPKKMCV